MRTECRFRGRGIGVPRKSFGVRPCKLLPKQLAKGELLIRPGPDEKFRLSEHCLNSSFSVRAVFRQGPIKNFALGAGSITKYIHLFQVERHEAVNVVQAVESPALPESGFRSIHKIFTKLRKF